MAPKKQGSKVDDETKRTHEGEKEVNSKVPSKTIVTRSTKNKQDSVQASSAVSGVNVDLPDQNKMYNQLMEDDLDNPIPGTFSILRSGEEGVQKVKEALVKELGADIPLDEGTETNQQSEESSEDDNVQGESFQSGNSGTEHKIPSDLPGAGLIVSEELWDNMAQVRLALSLIPIRNKGAIPDLGPRTIMIDQVSRVVNPYVQLTLCLFSKLSSKSGGYDFDKDMLRKIHTVMRGSNSKTLNDLESSEFEEVQNDLFLNDLLFVTICIGTMIFLESDIEKKWVELDNESLLVRVAVLQSEFEEAYKSFQTLSGIISKKELKVVRLPSYCCYNRALDLYVQRVCTGVSLADVLKVNIEPDIHIIHIQQEKVGPSRAKRQREDPVMDTTEFRTNIVDFTSVQQDVDKMKKDIDLLKRDMVTVKDSVKSLADSLNLIINRKSVQDVQAKQTINKTILGVGDKRQEETERGDSIPEPQNQAPVSETDENKLLVTRLKLMKDKEAASLSADLQNYFNAKGLLNYSANCTEADLKIALVRIQLIALLESL